jgi:hypothetical protein
MRAQPSTSEHRQTSISPWPLPRDWSTHAKMGWVAANASAHRACVEIAAECQTFAGRRLEKDVHLLQDLISAKARVRPGKRGPDFGKRRPRIMAPSIPRSPNSPPAQSLQHRRGSEASDPRR